MAFGTDLLGQLRKFGGLEFELLAQVLTPAEAIATAPRVDEALTLVPGVQLFRRTSSAAANPTTQGVSLRSIAPSGAATGWIDASTSESCSEAGPSPLPGNFCPNWPCSPCNAM